MPGAALRGLMAVRIAPGCPQNTREKDRHDDRYDDKWGSDIHVQSLDIQIIRALINLSNPRSTGV
jgi:hypothetical protein